MLAAAASVPLCLAVVACSVPGSGDAADGDGRQASSAAAVCKAPDFQGPHADAFRRSWEQAGTELAKRILEDCRITDAELAEIFDAQNTCLAPYGLAVSKGQLSQVRGEMLSADEMNDRNTECAEKTDLWSVESLYDDIHDNPDNLDADAMKRAEYECLRRQDLLPEPITEQEYLDMGPAGGLSEEENVERTRAWNEFFRIYMQRDENSAPNPDYDAAKAERFWQCQADPLNQR